MKDPRRLLEQDLDGFERELLDAGLSERMPNAARQRALAGAMIGVGALPAAKTASASSASTVTSGVTAAGGVAKWLVFGALLGGVSSGAIVATTRATTHPAPAPVRATAASPQPKLAAPHAQPPAAPTAVPATPANAKPPAARPRGSVHIGRTWLELELESLRRIRTLSQSDRAAALRALNAHDARFPHGSARHEARALRDQLSR